MKYFNQIFEVNEGQPIRKNRKSYSQMSINVKTVVEVIIPDENIWDNTPERLTIYIGKDGIGFDHEVPGGYSEYTYDPDTTSNYYVGADLDWFLRFGLDSGLRSMLTDSDLKILEFATKNPEYLNP